MSWTAVEDAVNKNPKLKVILPVGSIEQHGPHLPISTDSLIAEHIATRLARLSPSMLFPTLTVGYSLEHTGFPGTVTFTMQTYSSIIKEIAESLFDSGFKTLIIINGHGGNRAILDGSITSIKHAHQDLNLFSFTVLDIARLKFGETRRSPRKFIGHADELETSMMLAIHPNLVAMSKVVIEEPKFPPTISLETEDLAKVTYGWRTKDVTKSGIIGDPSFATPELGRLLLDYVVETITPIIGG